MQQDEDSPLKAEPVRILLVDVHAISRDSSRMLLDTMPDFEVVGETGDHNEAMRLAESLKPDVVIVSMRVEGSNGPDTTRDLIKLDPSIKVIFWTLFDDPEHVNNALKSGASAYVLKQDPASEVERAIEKVLNGFTYLSPTLKFIVQD